MFNKQELFEHSYMSPLLNLSTEHWVMASRYLYSQLPLYSTVLKRQHLFDSTKFSPIHTHTPTLGMKVPHCHLACHLPVRSQNNSLPFLCSVSEQKPFLDSFDPWLAARPFCATRGTGGRLKSRQRGKARVSHPTLRASCGILAVTVSPSCPNSCGQPSLCCQLGQHGPGGGLGSCLRVLVPDLWHHPSPNVPGQLRSETLFPSSLWFHLLCKQPSVFTFLP